MMATDGIHAGLQEGFDDGVARGAGSKSVLPVASGAIFWIGCGEMPQGFVVAPGRRCGSTCSRARPSLAVQSATRSGGRVSSVTGPACSSARI